METLTIFGICQMYIYDSIALYDTDWQALFMDVCAVFPMLKYDIAEMIYLVYASIGIQTCLN